MRLSLAAALVFAAGAAASPITATRSTSAAANPCAVDSSGVLPSPGPAYGLSSGSSSISGTQNDLYPLSSAEGATAAACCNTCNFVLENCVQAWWYFYEGCVVQQATVTATGTGAATSTCPNGVIQGLSYAPDSNQPFRSTGNIIGPCGAAYN